MNNKIVAWLLAVSVVACPLFYVYGESVGEEHADAYLKEQYNSGVAYGKSSGYEKGHSEGYEAGYQSGYDDGYAAHKNESSGSGKSQPKSTGTSSQKQEPKKSVVVYVTATGEKYHKYGCRYLRQSCYSIELSDAKYQGYTPCSVCHPPV